MLSKYKYTSNTVLNPETCYIYWSTIVNSENNRNNPKLYASKSILVLDILNKLWIDYISKEDSILELGCNCGTNLNYLYKHGYKKLYGVDINTESIELMKKIYPTFYKNSTIYNNEINSMLISTQNNKYDVVFTMAVLMHIHPENIKETYENIKRITKKYFITIENETTLIRDNFTWVRKYKEELKVYGFKEISKYKLSRKSFLSQDNEYIGYTIRIFKIIKE